MYGIDLSGKEGRELYRSLNQLNSWALCLSGGGIRSAAFALGLVQALAAHPRSSEKSLVGEAEDSLLSRFNYLSTVSGGGYTGSWLSAWRLRSDFSTIWNNLTSRPDGANIEPSSIAWLRSYSNYLTPKLGLLSADSWSIIAIYVRNLLVNWLVILPFLAAIILSFKLLGVALAGAAAINEDSWSPHIYFGLLGVASLVIALSYATANRPSRRALRSLRADPGSS